MIYLNKNKIYAIKVVSSITPTDVKVYPETFVDYEGAITDGVSGMTKYKDSTNSEEFFMAINNNQEVISLENLTLADEPIKVLRYELYCGSEPIGLTGDNITVYLRQKKALSGYIPYHISFYLVDCNFTDSNSTDDIHLIYCQNEARPQSILSSSYYIGMMEEGEGVDEFNAAECWDCLTNCFELVVTHGEEHGDVGFTIDLGSQRQVGILQLRAWGNENGTVLKTFISSDGDDFEESGSLTMYNNGTESVYHINIDADTRYIRVKQSDDIDYDVVIRSAEVFKPI